MATRPFELTRLDPATFEHLVNCLALKVLGMGATGFAPGADGGRDGYFEGEADYPSSSQRWSGVWYIQSKFRLPALMGDPQKWLLKKVEAELKEFTRSGSQRAFPNNWIIATNIDPTAVAKTGTFDKIRAMVREVDPKLAKRTHIWGGSKILQLLTLNPEISRHYGALLTSGDVLAKMFQSIEDAAADVEAIVRNLVVSHLDQQQYTKLEQAGSSSDTRPGIQSLFTDLPFFYGKERYSKVLAELCIAAAENHTPLPLAGQTTDMERWRRQPRRSKVWFVRGGPGNGKSTLTQYICQIHRAALIEGNPQLIVNSKISELSKDICERAAEADFFPLAARVPIHVELRLYAHWFGNQLEDSNRGLLTYLAHRIGRELEQIVQVGTLKRALTTGRWLIAFDGLDEVPGDVKDAVANAIKHFIDNVLIECKADALSICTSRPQGYSGQFEELRPSVVDLALLNPDEALACADPVLKIDRTDEEVSQYRLILQEAIISPAIQEIMTTPLQSHIMAVVVRDGGRPPERKWLLFSNFYQVIKKREANRNLADPKIARLLREGEKLIKALHNRLGFELHYRAEKSSGAQTSISREELDNIIAEIVNNLQDEDVDATISLLREATTERLVLVSTPESGHSVRFDIRPLQEFFAAEYIYESASEPAFVERLQAISADPHWREVMHFLLSAIIEQERRAELAQAIEVLSQLDDPPSDQRRTLARRLCSGSTLATRLLRTGVIESDKRNRNSFRKCLPPLLAATDAKTLLGGKPPQHSSAWLAAIAIDALAEYVPAENVGAACLLPIVLEDNSPHVSTIASYLASCDQAYLQVFVGSLRESAQGEKNEHPVWVIRALLGLVLADDWNKLAAPLLQDIYSVVGADRALFMKAREGLGTTEAAYLLWGIFSIEHQYQEPMELRELIGGLVRVSSRPLHREFTDFHWSEKLQSELHGFGGVASACCNLAMAAMHSSSEDLLALDAKVGGADGLESLPENFCDIFLSEARYFLRKRSIKENIRDNYLGEIIRYEIEDNVANVCWPVVLDRFPEVGILYCDESRKGKNRTSFQEWVAVPKNSEILLQKILGESSSSFLSLAHMRSVIIRFPDRASDIKRRLAISPKRRFHSYEISTLKTFRFDLPDDADLLVHLVCGVMPSINSRTLINYGDEASISQTVKLIHGFIPKQDSLGEIWKNQQHDSDIVAAAGVLRLALDSSVIEENDYFERMLKYYDISNSDWLVHSLLWLLTPAIQERKGRALDFANDLLQLASTDLTARRNCETVFAHWREITRAPVHETKSSRIWEV